MKKLTDEQKAKLDPNTRRQLWEIEIEERLENIEDSLKQRDDNYISIQKDYFDIEEELKERLEAQLKTKQNFEKRIKALEQDTKKSLWKSLFR